MLRAVDPQIEKLLILQDRDVAQITIESQLKTIPSEIDSFKKKIAEEQKGMESDLAEIKELEVQRSDLDKQVKAAEEKTLKYKNQQLEVKKNEEYQALTHEIENMGAIVSDLEEKEIELMLAIDEKKEVYAKLEAERKERIALLEKEIANLTERNKNLESQVVEAREAVAAARAEVKPAYLSGYTKAKQRKMKPPFVVPLNEQRCMGCHLKVSGESESSARHFKEMQTTAHCDSCGRVIYWP